MNKPLQDVVLIDILSWYREVLKEKFNYQLTNFNWILEKLNFSLNRSQLTTTASQQESENWQSH